MRRVRNGASNGEIVRHLLPDDADAQYPKVARAALDDELATEIARLLVNAYKYGQQSMKKSRGASP